MKITCLCIGKTTPQYLVEGIQVYQKRIQKYTPFECVVIPDLKNTKNWPAAQVKLKEGEAILKCLQPQDYVCLLDEHGKNFSSIAFSEHLQKLMNQSFKHLKFVIGGAYGFNEAVYKRANGKLALSTMTFSHQIIRLIFMEQLYRGFSILNNEPYHNQ